MFKSLQDLLKEKRISQITYDKVVLAKHYIEQKYNLKIIKKQEWKDIEERIESLNLSKSESEQLKAKILSNASQKTRKDRQKMTILNYESICIIGRGAFGEVRVCRDKRDGSIVAIKKIKKETIIKKNQILHTRHEQLFLAKVKSPWIVELKCSFEEGDHLYLVMDYCPGGDLMNLLIAKDIFTESEARFYIAEIILAVEQVHKLDCIHRDIKPDNILIDKTGHLKMSDFGLAKVSDKLYDYDLVKKGEQTVYKPNVKLLKNVETEDNTHAKNYSCVGTVYYVAPEVLLKTGYDQVVDWWSVGAIFYEMLIGYAPFCSKDTNNARHKILNWTKYLKIPSKAKLSKEAEDLIKRLITHPQIRLGVNGIEEIKSHPFFKGLDWDNIRNTKPPFIPFISSPYDSHYFETYAEKEPFYPDKRSLNKRRNVEYLGYNYHGKSNSQDESKSDYIYALELIDNYKKKRESHSNIHNNKKHNIDGDTDTNEKPSREEKHLLENKQSDSTKKDSKDSRNSSNDQSKGKIQLCKSASRVQVIRKIKIPIDRESLSRNKVINRKRNLKLNFNNNNFNQTKTNSPAHYTAENTINIDDKSVKCSSIEKNNGLSTTAYFFKSPAKDYNNINITQNTTTMNNISISSRNTISNKNNFNMVAIPKKKIKIDCSMAKNFLNSKDPNETLSQHSSLKKIPLYSALKRPTTKASPFKKRVDVSTGYEQNKSNFTTQNK